jgi:hypothetical protein
MKITNYLEKTGVVVNTGYSKLPYGSLLYIVGTFMDGNSVPRQEMVHCITSAGEHHFIARRELEEIELCFTDKGMYAVAKSMIRFSARLDREVVCYRFTINDNGVIISKKEFHTLKYLLGGNEDETNETKERAN